MANVVCDGKAVAVERGQRLLDALTGAGVRVPSSCRAGACQTCLVKATRGAAPAAAQVGLKEGLRLQGYFLACLAEPAEDLEITVDGGELSVPARIDRVDRIGVDVVRVRVLPERCFPHRGGQWMTLIRDDGLARPYSIASVPESPDGIGPLEIHVRVVRGGRMSGWLSAGEASGTAVQLRGPAGDCFYTPRDLGQPLLLAGTGTGLAPLWAITRDALRAGHTGPIEIWHGARTADGFYLVDELRALSRRAPQVVYRRCALEGGGDGEVSVGRLDQFLLARGAAAGGRAFLCGDPTFVASLKRGLFLAGLPLRDIHADAFVSAPPPG